MIPSAPVPAKLSWRGHLLRAVGWLILTSGVLAGSAWLGSTMRPSADSKTPESAQQRARQAALTHAAAADPMLLATEQAPDHATGELLYRVHCLKCHGPEGQGDPEAIERLTPPPRDFAARPWRFAVTAESIRRVIREGIPQTAMPAARDYFSEAELNALVHYVLRLAGAGSSSPRTDAGPLLTGVNASNSLANSGAAVDSSRPESFAAADAIGTADAVVASGKVASADAGASSVGSRPDIPSLSAPRSSTSSGTLLAELTPFGFRAVRETVSAPELRLLSVAGSELHLSELRGKWVLVNFWGIDCVPCLKSLPAIAELVKPEVAENLVVLSICANETDEESIVAVAKEIAPGLPVYLDQTGLAGLHYDVQSLPQYWLIDPAGRRVARASGAVDWKSLALASRLPVPDHLTNDQPIRSGSKPTRVQP